MAKFSADKKIQIGGKGGFDAGVKGSKVTKIGKTKGKFQLGKTKGGFDGGISGKTYTIGKGKGIS